MRLGAVIFLIASLLAGPARADYEAGIVAYETGRYSRALANFRSLAEHGDARAEFMIGAMYFYGRGVAKDDGAAAIWFYKAAHKGNPTAQFAFGSLYIRGTGVRRDLVNAYMWLSLAAESGVPALQQQAVILRDDAAQLMSDKEVERGRRLAEEFEPRRAGLSTRE